MVKINMGAKSLSEGVTYIKPLTQLNVGRTEQEEKVLFTAENLLQEVMEADGNVRHRKIKSLKRIMKIALTTLGVTAQMAPRALAATAQTGIAPITPAMIMDYGLTLAFIVVSCGVAFAMIGLTLAGIARMFKRRDIATEWTTDIIKGLVQVLIAIPVVLVLFFIAQHLFQGLPKLGSLF